jgi:leader peptidase (prepilin peptidase) / N-methyltransferase
VSELLASLPLPILLSPWALALLGLMIGSFLNVVAHRLPLMLERQWWGDVAAQLGDGASHKRVFDADMPAALERIGSGLEQSLKALAPLGIARPGSRCPHCGHRIRFLENVPVISWIALRGRCSAVPTSTSG